ncbi:MAG: sigma-70 family RNA polymerase sigma factor [Thiobacillus sp.]|nr:sigma-70 family RNA polymerase sigma factor [Thiobacillus sp.]
MAHAQDGDQGAYRRLLQDITPYIRSIAGRRLSEPSDIEDAVQDVLLTVHSIRHTYDPTRPFAPWLATIANRRVVDILRRVMRSRSRHTPLEPMHETFASPETNIEEGVSNADVLAKAIDKLPQSQREAVTLLKLKEMSLNDAAVSSGMSVASLKVAMHRALKNLRKIIGDEGGEA